MKKIILLLVLLLFCFSLPAKKLEPVRTSVGKLNVSVDPRTELLGVIQIMADYPLVTKNSPYSNEVKAYFEPMKDSKAVEVTRMLLQEYGFSYDAPVDFILRLSQPLQLKRIVPYSEDVKIVLEEKPIFLYIEMRFAILQKNPDLNIFMYLRKSFMSVFLHQFVKCFKVGT